MEITVKKITSLELALKACESTFLGKSKVSLDKLFRSEHSPSRTQQYWIECKSIPLFVSTHLLRHHVGSQPFALTHRKDRNGGVDEGRNTPTDLGLLINAQGLIDMAKLRLCHQASVETRKVMQLIKDSVEPELRHYLVAKCVYRNGLCGEMKCCGYNKTKAFDVELKEYIKPF